MLRRSARRCFSSTAVLLQSGFAYGPGIQSVHPDQCVGNASPFDRTYKGKGWTMNVKSLPVDMMAYFPGGGLQSAWDRQGPQQDPEDPRMPMMLITMGEYLTPAHDSSCSKMLSADYGPIPQSSRLMQLLYANYLEPVCMSRTHGILDSYSKVPNDGVTAADTFTAATDFDDDTAYFGTTMNAVGRASWGAGSTIMESTVVNGGESRVVLGTYCQVMENCVFTSARPENRLHYSHEHERTNPYHTIELDEGQTFISGYVTIEPGCLIESCNLQSYCRIGHGSKLLKGCEIGYHSIILPGSVVAAGTKVGEGEIWGGAPAHKVAKVSKFDYKHQWQPASSHRWAVGLTHKDVTRYGDQTVLWADTMMGLNMLLLEHEKDLSPGVKAQIREFMHGREPYSHTIARLTQAWTPANRVEQTVNDMTSPIPLYKPTRNHNDDSDSDYSGTIFNWKHYWTAESKM